MDKQQRHYCGLTRLTRNKLIANQCLVAKAWQPLQIFQISKEKKRFKTTSKFCPVQSTTDNITETTDVHKSCTICMYLLCTPTK